MSDAYAALLATMAPVLGEAGLVLERIPFERASRHVICVRANGKRVKASLVSRSYTQQDRHREFIRCTVPNLEDECALITVVSIDGCDPYFYLFPSKEIRGLLRDQTRDPSQLYRRDSKSLVMPHPAREESRYLPYLGAAHLL